MFQDMFSAAGMGRFSDMFTNAGYSHPCKKSNEREENKIKDEIKNKKQIRKEEKKCDLKLEVGKKYLYNSSISQIGVEPIVVDVVLIEDNQIFIRFPRGGLMLVSRKKICF